MLHQDSVFLPTLQQQQQQYENSVAAAGFFSAAAAGVCADASGSPVDYHPYSPDYCDSDRLLAAASPFSSMAQPMSPSSTSVSSAVSPHHHHHQHHHHSRHRMSPPHFHQATVYQNWTFAPSSRAQRRHIQPEIYARRRATANLRERGRMSEMNQAFDRLRNLVPSYPACGRKMSKIDTLRLAKQYIQDLHKLASDGTVSEGYDFQLRLSREADSSDGDYSSASPASSTDMVGIGEYASAGITC